MFEELFTIPGVSNRLTAIENMHEMQLCLLNERKHNLCVSNKETTNPGRGMNGSCLIQRSRLDK